MGIYYGEKSLITSGGSGDIMSYIRSNQFTKGGLSSSGVALKDGYVQFNITTSAVQRCYINGLEVFSSCVYYQDNRGNGLSQPFKIFEGDVITGGGGIVVHYENNTGEFIYLGPNGYIKHIDNQDGTGDIELSNQTDTILIADRNLGATKMYREGDELTAENCGGFFQRGNNYMFPFSGATKTSSTQVDASAYGPKNYYNSDTFIIAENRDSSNNADLRGGVTGTKEARRGPCPVGYHIANSTEMNNLITLHNKITGTNSLLDLFPLAGWISRNNGGIVNKDKYGYVFLSDSYSNNNAYIGKNTGSISNEYKTIGLPIRPFKN